LNEHRQDIPAVLNALFEKAKKGDVPAARELRGWYDQGLGKPEGVSLSEGDTTEDKAIEDMTPGERAVLRARVVREIARLEAEEASESAPTDEAF
jgi:hypothetical protein